MANSRFYLDNRRTKPGKQSPLKLIVQHQHKSVHISIDLKLDAEQWDNVKERIINHPCKQALNIYLRETQQTVERTISTLVSEGKLRNMDIKELRDHIYYELHPEEKVDDATFEYRFLKFVALKKESTKKTYMHTLNRIHAFIGEEKLKTLRFEDITKDWLNDLNTFMAKTSPSPNARNIHFRNIRAVFNDAIENDITTAYPFRKFKIKNVETAKRSLTVEELRQLLFFPCQPHQQKYVDIFRLMFYLMGVNIIDLVQLKEMHNGRLDFNRSKTAHLYSMKVEPEAMALFEQYKGSNYLLDILDRWCNHEYFRRKMNKELQKIGPMHKAAGRGGKNLYSPLFPTVTSYWARHTWATIAAEIDIPDRTIAEALGHEFGNRITNIYIRFDIKKVDKANRRVLDWVLYGILDGEVVVEPGTPEFFGLSEGVAVSLGLCKAPQKVSKPEHFKDSPQSKRSKTKVQVKRC